MAELIDSTNVSFGSGNIVATGGVSYKVGRKRYIGMRFGKKKANIYLVGSNDRKCWHRLKRVG